MPDMSAPASGTGKKKTKTWIIWEKIKKGNWLMHMYQKDLNLTTRLFPNT